MKPTRDRNTKARPDIRAPIPGMDWQKIARSGEELAAPKTANNRRGDRGKRNKENSLKDRNLGDTDSSGQAIPKTRTGLPTRDLRDVQPEVVNPAHAHPTGDTRAPNRRELHRRRKQIRQSAEPARHKKEFARHPH